MHVYPAAIMAPKIRRPASALKKRPGGSVSGAWTSGKSTPRPELRRRAAVAEELARATKTELRQCEEKLQEAQREAALAKEWVRKLLAKLT